MIASVMSNGNLGRQDGGNRRDEGLPSHGGRDLLDDVDGLLGKAGGENFPVALRFLPRQYRQNLSTVYNFARLVDDIGDEVPEAERGDLLDLLEDEVGRVMSGAARFEVTRALSRTVAECSIPADPFLRLIEANRRDQVVAGYETFDELLEYCDLSANPVGRVVLYIFGAATPERLSLSDSVCTALQLVEHWQDVAEDLGKGRVYLPREDLRRFGCDTADLKAPHVDGRMRDLMAFECDRASRILDDGARLVGTLRGAARVAVAGYVAGGRTALKAVARAGYDVLAGPPKAPRSRMVAPALRTYLLGR
jgi:squalene synthase HpnC